MKITIEPDFEEEEGKIEAKTYHNVIEFIICGTVVEHKMLPHSFSHAHGDSYVLIGKIEEVKERLREAIHNGATHVN